MRIRTCAWPIAFYKPRIAFYKPRDHAARDWRLIDGNGRGEAKRRSWR
jgi:hypothetical protein